MTPFRSARLAVILGGALVFASGVQARPDPSGSDWWSHIQVLAGNAYEGRLTGSPGYERAARYVAGQFAKAGLKPAGEKGGWLQRVAFISQTVDGAASKVTLSAAGHSEPLNVGVDLVLGARLPQPKTVTAPLVFIGYGLSLPEAGYDDFAGQDLKGKIAVNIAGGPDTISGPLQAHSRAYVTWKAVQKAGALGLITIPNPNHMDIPWARLKLLSQQSGMYIADPAFWDAKGERFTAMVNPAKAQALFAASGHRFADVLALADAHRPISGFPLNATISADVAARLTKVSSPNVVGVLAGSDPVLKGQFVVVSAHLDHLGVGAPIQGDPIYHGAMDNASGVASLIEVAKAIKGGAEPKRSLLFVAVTGEEKGLLGSRYFAERPTVDRRALVADINMDEFLPLYPLRHLTVLGENESTLGAASRVAAAKMGLDVVPDGEPDRNLFVRSDQYSFIRTGVPSIDLMFGHPPGSPEDKIISDWNQNRYHSPQDNLSQPVDKAAASRFNAYLDTLILQVADAPKRPRWLDTSFFKRFAAK